MARGRRLALIAAAGALAVGSVAAGCGGGSSSGSADTSGGGGGLSGEIAGAGSSAQSAAQTAWAAGFQTENSGATVSYDPVGSGAGRTQFISGGTAFGGSDVPLADQELTDAQNRCGGVDNLVEIPVYVSPIAIAYNLSGVDSLQLTPDTLAKIMNHDITKWNDPAIAADNPGVSLPSTGITTVSRSDKSGTTENFQEYLSAVAPKVWTYEVADTWPVKGGESAQGTSGVVDAISSGDGTIGYADASQVGDLGVASLKVGATYQKPTAEAAAKVLDESPKIDTPGANVFTYDLRRDTASQGVYPNVLTSYEMACTTYDDANTAALVKGYLNYIISQPGQQAAASAAGSAPVSAALAAKIQPAVDAIGS
jgi:phosphate transport system substrate-binding protein